MGYHDVAGHERRKPTQKNEMQAPRQSNVLAAASHVRRLFESKKLTYAVMGELALLCLGHRCEVRDIFIAYDDKDCSRIKKKLEGDRRIQLPEGISPLSSSKILVQTGPSFLDTGCTSPATIEVNLVPAGSYETPPSGDLASNIVLLSLRADGVLKTFYALNMLYLVRTLLHFCQIRSLAWEPREGILFLCQLYRSQVEAIRCHLQPKIVEENFLRTAFLNRLPVQEQRKCYQTLLAQEPPLLKTLATPQPEAIHTRSQSTFGVTRSPGIVRASLPDFLCPPQSQNVKSSHVRTAQTTSKLVEPTQASQKTMNSSRDSASRYRVVSAPNSRRTSPTDPRFTANPQAQGSTIKQLKLQIPVSSHHQRAFSHSVTNTDPVAVHQLGQQCLKSRPVSTGTRIAQPPAKHAPTVTNLSIPGVSTRHQIPRKTYPDISGAHVPEQGSSRLHIVNPDGEAPSCHKSQGETQKLHLVGPEGVYQSPPTSSKPSPAANETHKALNTSLPAFEVNETSPPNDILAELSANIDAALQVGNHPCTSPPPATVQPQGMNRPLVPRASSAPFNTLPASLTIGSTSHRHSITPQTSTSAGSITRTNALRYSQQPSAPTLASIISDGLASPTLTPAPLSFYKAYQPNSASASPPNLDMSPLDSACAEYNSQFANFGQVKDVDGMGHYFATHKHTGSHAVRPVSKSFDSSQLAMEYRAALPEFEDGYGGR